MIIYDADITGSLKVNGSDFNLSSISSSIVTNSSSIASLETVSGSYANSASFASNISANSASIASLETVSGSYANSASFASNISANSASIASLETVSGSYANSASFASNISANSSSIGSLNAVSSSYLLNTTDTLTGDLTVTGNIIATTLNVQDVTASVIYSSGSNIFGSSSIDTQQFTGSILTSGSIEVNGNKFTVNGATGNATFAGTISSTSTSTNTLAGKLRINGTTTTGLEIASSPGSSSGLKIYNDSSNDHAYILNHYGGNLVLGTNNAPVITLNGTNSTFAGNVGVGNAGTFENPNSYSKVIEIANSDTVGLILNDTRDTNPMSISNEGAVIHLRYNTTSMLALDGATSRATFLGNVDIRGSGYNQIRIANNTTANTNKQSGITTLNYEGNEVSIIETFQQNNSNDVYYGSADASFVGIQNHRFFVNTDSNTPGSGHTQALLIQSNTNATFAGNITFGDSHFIGDDGSDNLLIQGSAGENIIIDSADDVILDADGGDIIFKDAGTEIGRLDLAGGLALKSSVSDADFFIQGNDGGSIINALQLDMSAGGAATFAGDVTINGAQYVNQIQARTSAGLKLGNDNNSGFVFIKDSKEVCIGTENPSSNTNYGTGDLNVENDTFASAQIFSHNSTAGNYSFLGLGKSSGTGASPTIVQAQETVGAISYYGYDGAAYQRLATISADVDGTPGAGDMPGRLEFSTTADGASTPTTRMVIGQQGVVTVGSAKRYVDSGNTQFDLEVTEGMAFGGAAFTYATIQGDSAGHGNIEICANAYPANTGAESKITFKTSTSTGGQYTDALVIKGPNVGIGEPNPNYKLNVASGTNTDGIYLSGLGNAMSNGEYRQLQFGYSDTDTSYGSTIRFAVPDATNHGGQIEFYTDAGPGSTTSLGTLALSMFIDPRQNVGIGTNTIPSDIYTASGGGYTTLKMGQSSFLTAYKADDSIELCQNTYLNTNGANNGVTASVPAGRLTLVDGAMVFQTLQTTSNYNQTAQNVLNISSAGLVQISSNNTNQASHEQTLAIKRGLSAAGTVVPIAFVDHTHALDITVIIKQDTSNVASGRGHSVVAYGSGSAGMTQVSNSGNVTGITLAYLNTNPSGQNYVLTLTWAGSGASPDAYITIRGNSTSVIAEY